MRLNLAMNREMVHQRDDDELMASAESMHSCEL